jgi:predicted ribonuclease YlaK
MSVLEAKAFLTRIGENSKIILLGDIEQIDTGMNGIETNGLI